VPAASQGTVTNGRPRLYLLRWAENLDSEDFLDIFLDIIDSLLRVRGVPEAIGVCQKIYEADRLEDKSLILQRMGLIYGKMGKEDMEIESYQRALEINPNNKQVRFRLSEMYERTASGQRLYVC